MVRTLTASDPPAADAHVVVAVLGLLVAALVAVPAQKGPVADAVDHPAAASAGAPGEAVLDLPAVAAQPPPAVLARGLVDVAVARAGTDLQLHSLEKARLRVRRAGTDRGFRRLPGTGPERLGALQLAALLQSRRPRQPGLAPLQGNVAVHRAPRRVTVIAASGPRMALTQSANGIPPGHRPVTGSPAARSLASARTAQHGPAAYVPPKPW